MRTSGSKTRRRQQASFMSEMECQRQNLHEKKGGPRQPTGQNHCLVGEHHQNQLSYPV